MKLLTSAVAVIMLSILAIYSTINLFVNPIWMVSMIAYSSIFIYMIAKDIASDLKKVKAFTMIELMAVITLMAILLGISMNVLKPDRAATAIKQVGSNISLWNTRAMSEGTSYRLEFNKNLLEVYDIDNRLVHSEKILSDLSFVDHDEVPKASQIIEFNKRAEMTDLLGAKIYADTWVVIVNGFTGHVSYYEDEDEEL